jgi:hypothetical protein
VEYEEIQRMSELITTVLERVVIGTVGMIAVLILKMCQLKLSKCMILWGISTIDTAKMFSNLFDWSAFIATVPLMTVMFYFLHKEPPSFPTTHKSRFSNRIYGFAGAMSHFVTVSLLWVIIAAMFSNTNSP